MTDGDRSSLSAVIDGIVQARRKVENTHRHACFVPPEYEMTLGVYNGSQSGWAAARE